MATVNRKVSFHEFFLLWTQLNKWEVPDFHYRMMDFFSSYNEWENNTGLIQIFRGAGKSTMVGLYITWRLYCDPSCLFLVLSGDKKTAVKITTDIANIVRRHPLAKKLHGKENAWRSDTLVVNGATDGRNPSVTSWGVLSSITGARATDIIYDDVEVPNNSGTEEEREKLRIKLDEPTHILVPGGRELFIGTPHSFDSIYPEIEGSSNKDQPFRTGCSSIKIPAIENPVGEFPFMTGDYTWPERFGEAEMLKRQISSYTKGHFLSQYLLQPYNPEETELDTTLISEYDGELLVHAANGGISAVIKRNDQDPGVRVVWVYAFWDPSLSAKRDDSVLAVVYATENGHYYIHRTVKIVGDRDADAQIKHVQQVMKECHVNHVVIESNGIGGFLETLFRQKSAGMGLSCIGMPSTQKKEEKILAAFETPLAAGLIHAHKSVMNSPFRSQLRDFSSRGTKGKDDYIDSVASAILNQPKRLKSGFAGNRFADWYKGADSADLQIEAVTF